MSKEFSVLQSVYKNDKPEFLRESLQSIANSTIKPKKIVLVKDGKVSEEIESEISKWINKLPIEIYEYEENKGLAHALNYGLQYINTELTARMDSDDICFPTRFEEQIKYFEENPDAKILGTGILEFYQYGRNKNKKTEKIRLYPENTLMTSQSLFRGTPLAHPTLMIKTELLKKFRYEEDIGVNEDIDLWFRLLEAGYTIHTLRKPLLNFRITENTFKRRSFDKSINEYKVYRKYLKKFFGNFNYNHIYPLIRLCTRFFPSFLKKKLYLSNLRQKILNK